MEKLFLLEVLVENVEIDYTKVDVDKKVLDAAKQLCIKIQFLSFPELTICEEDFGANTTGDYQKNNVNIKSGKSCLFSIRHWKAEDRSMPLNVTVSRTNPSPPHISIGRACINLGSSFTNILAAAQSKEYTETMTKKCTDVYVLTNNSGTDVGKLRMFVRLTCFGPLIVTQFQISGDENNSFLFRGNDGSGIVTFNRNSSGDLSEKPLLPPHIPTKQVPCGGSQEPKPPQESARPPDCPPCPPCPPYQQDWNAAPGHGTMPQRGQGMMPQGGQGMMPPGQGMMPQGQGMMPQGQGMMPQGQGMMPQGQGMMPQGQGMMPWGEQTMTPWGEQRVPPGGQMAMPVLGSGMMPWCEPVTIMTAGGQGMMPETGFMTMAGSGHGIVPGEGQGMMPGMGPGMMPGMGQGMMPGEGPGMMPGGGQGMMPGMGHGMMPGGGLGMMRPGGDLNALDYKEFGAEVNGHSLSIKVLRKPNKPKKVVPPLPICGHIPIGKKSSSSSSEEEIPPSQPPIQFCECDYPLPPGFLKTGYPQGPSPTKKKKKKKNKDNNLKCPLECSGGDFAPNYMTYQTLTNMKAAEVAEKTKNQQLINKQIGMLGDAPANLKMGTKTMEEQIHTSGNPAFILNIPPKPNQFQNQQFETNFQSEQAKLKSKRIIESWTQYNEKDVIPPEKQPGPDVPKKEKDGKKKKGKKKDKKKK